MKIILTEADITFHNDLLLLLMKHSNSLNHLKVDFLNCGEVDISAEFTISYVLSAMRDISKLKKTWE